MLSFNGTKIMLDFRVDWSQLLAFLPFASNAFPGLATDSKHLKDVGGKKFIDDRDIRIQVPRLEAIDISDIDILLISNAQVLLSLPFLTSIGGFSGTIYASEPTVQLGRELCLDLLAQIQQRSQSSLSFPRSSSPPSSCPESDTHVSEPAWVTELRSDPKYNASTWHQMYTEHQVFDMLDKIETVSFNEIKVSFSLSLHLLIS